MSLKTIMETVLVVGATGNIGVSAVTAALRSKRNVLAIVRNQTSADKLVKHIGSSEGITFVEANVLSDSGVKGVVDQVKSGKLPAFQHVFSSGQSPEPSPYVALQDRYLHYVFSSWRRVHYYSPPGDHYRSATEEL